MARRPSIRQSFAHHHRVSLDTAVLIAFAAWAKDAGHARGEFIDLQLEEARRHRAHTYVADWVPFAKQARELLNKYDALWLMPLQHMLDERLITNPTLYRGFVEDVDGRPHAR